MTTDEHRTLIARLARALGLDVVAEDWPCVVDANGIATSAYSSARGDTRPWPVHAVEKYWQPIPNYLSWEGMGSVIEAMRERGFHLASAGAVGSFNEQTHDIEFGAGYAVSFMRNGYYRAREGEGRGDTLPIATVKAALSALGGSDGLS